jgi:hypothetical protein
MTSRGTVGTLSTPPAFQRAAALSSGIEPLIQIRTLTYDHSAVTRPLGTDIGRKIDLSDQGDTCLEINYVTSLESLTVVGVSARLLGYPHYETHSARWLAWMAVSRS